MERKTVVLALCVWAAACMLKVTFHDSSRSLHCSLFSYESRFSFVLKQFVSVILCGSWPLGACHPCKRSRHITSPKWWCADCTFSDFEGDVMVYTGSGDSAVFEGCKFLDNTAEIAVLTGRSGSIENSGLVRIVASSFERNAAPSVLQARSWEAGEAPVFFRCALCDTTSCSCFGILNQQPDQLCKLGYCNNDPSVPSVSTQIKV